MRRKRIKGTTAMLVEQERRERGRERVELDYEAALEELRRARPEWTPYVGDPFVIRNIVDAAIGSRLLIDPPTEEER